jgi:hypothetical protein
MVFHDLLAEADEYLPWMPNWLWAALMLVAVAASALLLHRAAVRLIRRLIPPKHAFLQSLLSATDGQYAWHWSSSPSASCCRRSPWSVTRRLPSVAL